MTAEHLACDGSGVVIHKFCEPPYREIPSGILPDMDSSGSLFEYSTVRTHGSGRRIIGGTPFGDPPVASPPRIPRIPPIGGAPPGIGNPPINDPPGGPPPGSRPPPIDATPGDPPIVGNPPPPPSGDPTADPPSEFPNYPPTMGSPIGIATF